VTGDGRTHGNKYKIKITRNSKYDTDESDVSENKHFQRSFELTWYR